jgi:hypothetical protein
MKTKRKKPLVVPVIKSLRKAREVTSAFHELTTAVQVNDAVSEPRRAALLLRLFSHSSSKRYSNAFHRALPLPPLMLQKAQQCGDKKQMAEAQANLESLGGREAYQVIGLALTNSR